MDERPLTVVIPTELERSDAFVDGALLAGTVLVAWWLALRGLGVYAVPVVLCVGVWTLTGEPATDVPFIGALAAGLRNTLGVRRINEWFMAWWHFFRVRTWPDFRTACLRRRDNLQRWIRARRP